MEDELTDFMSEGIATIGNQIIIQARSATKLPSYYRREFAAYLKDALRIIEAVEQAGPATAITDEDFEAINRI